MIYDRVQMSQPQCDNFIAKLCNEFHTLQKHKYTTLGNCDEKVEDGMDKQMVYPKAFFVYSSSFFSHLEITLFGLLYSYYYIVSFKWLFFSLSSPESGSHEKH